MIRLLLISFIFFPSFLVLQEKDSWIIDDIRISGLQRVSAGSVFAVMPVGLGEEIDRELFKEIASSIFQTGKFDDVKFCLLYTSPSPRDLDLSRMPSSA